MPISKEDDKCSWEQYHIIPLSHIALYWIWSLLNSDESLVVTRFSPPIFSLQHYCRFRKRMQLYMDGLRLNSLFLYYLFHHLYLFFLFFFFNFHSFHSLYFFLFYSFFFYFLLQPMLILTCLSWCHKFQLLFMSLMPQIKGSFIKIDCFKIKPCPSQKKMTRVRGSNITWYFFHTLSYTEFDPCLIRMKAWW